MSWSNHTISSGTAWFPRLRLPAKEPPLYSSPTAADQSRTNSNSGGCRASKALEFATLGPNKVIGKARGSLLSPGVLSFLIAAAAGSQPGGKQPGGGPASKSCCVQ